jgi:FkbM family methyltransferase
MKSIRGFLLKAHSRVFSTQRRLRDINMKLDQIERKQESLSAALERTEDLQRTAMKYDATGIIHLSDKEIAAKIFNDLILYLDPRDLAVVPHIALERIWEREITYAWLRALEKNVRDDPIVFDIGANFGYYGALAAQLNKARGKVYLFEPNFSLHHYINRTLSVNWLNENTVVENKGIGEKNGIATLNVLRDFIGSSSMQSVDQLNDYIGDKMNAKTERAVKVPIVSIDSYCETKGISSIDLMKIDIEGYEEKAYSGMTKMIKKSPKMILFVEFTKSAYDDPTKFYKAVSKDFKFVYTIAADGSLVAPKDKSYEGLISKVDVLIFLVFSKISLRPKENRP